MLRRTKELVAPELPAEAGAGAAVELAPRTGSLYDTVLQRERQKLLGLHRRPRPQPVHRLPLADAAAHAQPRRGAHRRRAYAGVPSAKLDALFEQLDEVVAEGHRALVFSQFTSFLRACGARLDAAGVAYAYLDGSTPRRGEVDRAVPRRATHRCS